MIPISAEEIRQYWHAFCERQGVSAEVRAAGDERIDGDPEHWADQTMPDLLEAVTARRAS